MREKPMRKVNQESQVLRYLDEHNGITSREAFINLGITQLGTRIFNLKRDGYSFSKKREEYTGSDGVVRRYDRYFLIK